MEVRLTIVGGKASRKVVSIKLPAVIGRSREADLTIAHPMVSRRHCELFEVQGLVRIRDLGSLNGTLVGGKEVTEAPLRPNDEFSIGPLTFRVEYEYGGEVTVVAPIVPEERSEEAPTSPPPPRVPEELPPFFRLPLENVAHPAGASSGQRAKEADHLRVEDRVTAHIEPGPPTEFQYEPASPPIAPDQSVDAMASPPHIPPSAEEQPATPSSLFADWAPPEGRQAAQQGDEAYGLSGKSAADGQQTLQPLDFLSERGFQSVTEGSELVEPLSVSSPFAGISGGSLGEENFGPAIGGGPSPGQPGTGEVPPVIGATVTAGPDQFSPGPVSFFEPSIEEQSSEGGPVSWLEEPPAPSDAPTPWETDAQAPSATPTPPATSAAPGPSSQAPKKGWWWWPFGKRKRDRAAGGSGSAKGDSGKKHSTAGQPDPELSTPPVLPTGVVPPALGEVGPSRSASPSPPSGVPTVPNPPPESNARAHSDLEAFLRDLQ